MTLPADVIARLEKLLDRAAALLPAAPPAPEWEVLAYRWQRHTGRGALHGITRLSDLRFDDLLCIDDQIRQIDLNTRQFLGRLPANNVLLWGPRGTGKSSLIKALLNEHAAAGLRLIEVERGHLTDLPAIVDLLHDRPEYFVIFCDDLSFEAGDASYKALKVILDGSVHATPANVLVYATSNRRHLLPEHLTDNLAAHNIDGEIHHAEAVEERISLSERFGLWLALHPFTQDEYLRIVHHWLRRLGVDARDDGTVQTAALQWALQRGSRSGRSAWQFAKDWAGRTRLNSTV
jgi:predicted AAA+ superfamily ATPase